MYIVLYNDNFVICETEEELTNYPNCRIFKRREDTDVFDELIK